MAWMLVVIGTSMLAGSLTALRLLAIAPSFVWAGVVVPLVAARHRRPRYRL